MDFAILSQQKWKGLYHIELSTSYPYEGVNRYVLEVSIGNTGIQSYSLSSTDLIPMFFRRSFREEKKTWERRARL